MKLVQSFLLTLSAFNMNIIISFKNVFKRINKIVIFTVIESPYIDMKFK